MVGDLIFWAIGLFPLWVVLFYLWHNKRHPEEAAEYRKRNAGRDVFGADSWGP